MGSYDGGHDKTLDKMFPTKCLLEPQGESVDGAFDL
jgi:hypothetical protein